jgi:hypothetical protein
MRHCTKQKVLGGIGLDLNKLSRSRLAGSTANSAIDVAALYHALHRRRGLPLLAELRIAHDKAGVFVRERPGTSWGLVRIITSTVLSHEFGLPSKSAISVTARGAPEWQIVSYLLTMDEKKHVT